MDSGDGGDTSGEAERPAGPVEPPPSPWDFPDLRTTMRERDLGDLVARGADLEAGTLLAAYRAGLFPMGDGPVGPVSGRLRRRPQPMAWWSPVERGVLPLAGLTVSRSLGKAVRRLTVRVDTAFEQVVAACADPNRPGAWITDEIAAAYLELHRLGWAHSVETWQDDELVGGLYGVAIGGLFAGESMFHRVTDASKVALVGLVGLLSDEYADLRLLDVQWSTPHLESLGARTISRVEYLDRLEVALRLPLPPTLF